MTNEERLEHERLVADVAKIRDSDAEKPRRDLLNSSVIASLVTALAGTLGAGLVVATYQTCARRDEQALVDRKARGEAQQRAVERALNTLAEGEYHARGKYALTRRAFQTKSVAEVSMSHVEQQRAKIINGSNDFEAMWPAQKKSIAALLNQTFERNATVVNSWNAAAASLDAFLEIARKEYGVFLDNPALTVDKVPMDPNTDADLRSRIDAFMSSVEQATRAHRPTG